MSFVSFPRCVHGEAWNTCTTCKTYAWCAECLDLMIIKPEDDRGTILCSRCADQTDRRS